MPVVRRTIVLPLETCHLVMAHILVMEHTLHANTIAATGNFLFSP